MQLYLKLTILVAALSLAIGGTSALLVSYIMNAAFEQELKVKGVVLAQSLAERLYRDVMNEEVVSARQVLQDFVRRTEDMEFAYLTAFNNEIFAHSFIKDFPKELLSDGLKNGPVEPADMANPQLEKFITNKGPILQVANPLIEGMKAHLFVGLNESRLFQRSRKLRNQILAVTFGFSIFGTLIAILLSRHITRPLRTLSEAMAAFGRRTDEEAITVAGGDAEVAGSRN